MTAVAAWLQLNALLTLEEAKGYLGLTGSTDQDDLVTDVINRVSDYCEAAPGANRPLRYRDFLKLRYPGQRGPRLRLAATPIDVDAAVRVSLDGVDQTVWRKESDGDPATKDVIVGADEPGTPSFLYRAAGWLGATPFPVLLSYCGGFWPIPGDLREAAQLILGQVWREQTGRAPAEVQSYGAGPVSPGIVFRESLIPLRAREILTAYRVVTL